MTAQPALSLGDFSTLFALVGRSARIRAERLLNDFGLHAGQQFFLRCLWEADGSTVGELARQVRVEAPTATRAVKRLEAAGMVRRTPDDQDARRSRVWLTPAGRHTWPQVTAALAELEQELLAPFSVEEREQLMSLLLRLYETSRPADGSGVGSGSATRSSATRAALQAGEAG
ncbi:MarR family transcriptional regulator [Streptomyces sp. JV185]|uniref:MarR family winged helix-turn-helix transcriptional regulator n=1 Tax=Streptomyces sp. JV185 TaxID=858638 RepID=UPI002E7A123E|nr:MarR family transcriptional regulator [Streptomyces sp. JV185]MEE1770258.1 MarR family transcriptional regulator [Streptomyces sp. JV185]